MKNQNFLIGSVAEVISNSYINVKDDQNEVVKCYVAKALAAKGLFNTIGESFTFGGGYKKFSNGTNYFVIHRANKGSKIGSSHPSEGTKVSCSAAVNPLEKYGEDYFDQLFKHLSRKVDLTSVAAYEHWKQTDPGKVEGYEKIEIEICDSAVGDGQISKTFEAYKLGTFLDSGSKEENKEYKNLYERDGCYCRPKKSSDYDFFFETPKLIKNLKGGDLSTKKGGSKFEGKIKVEVLKVRFENEYFEGYTNTYSIDKKENEKWTPDCDWLIASPECHPQKIPGIQMTEKFGWFQNVINGKRSSISALRRSGNFERLCNSINNNLLPTEGFIKDKGDLYEGGFAQAFVNENWIGKYMIETKVKVKKIRITIER